MWSHYERDCRMVALLQVESQWKSPFSTHWIQIPCLGVNRWGQDQSDLSFQDSLSAPKRPLDTTYLRLGKKYAINGTCGRWIFFHFGTYKWTCSLANFLFQSSSCILLPVDRTFQIQLEAKRLYLCHNYQRFHTNRQYILAFRHTCSNQQQRLGLYYKNQVTPLLYNLFVAMNDQSHLTKWGET